ncbi:acetoacetyl-CoA synthetase [Spinactinospora alkalitolerans]|uniref:Acetoacetyl-CoA synthetase n=1 Tax=Spinactinospora alkalitolerans TaxID=687207 RepID=A0A852U5F1_9ACTN|nr:acetoacetate--CoA ligase [Spinactinospora alkalitolerans]NYE50732.1 acetoacetyl-CoA synthetase [Spinactinospora alkalitolerans]
MSSESVMWAPDPERVRHTRLSEFMKETGFADASYDALHRWSIAEPAEFWSAMWRYADVIGDRGRRTFVRNADRPMTESRFFPDASVNIAENLLRGSSDDPAVVEADETKRVREVTRGELRAMVGKAQRLLTSLGVQRGDRVAGILPNTVDALAYTLGALSLGAVWTSCAPEFGVRGVLDRFGQVSPAVLIVAESYVYNGKRHSLVTKGLEVAAGLPGLEHIMVIGGGAPATRAGTARVHSDVDPSGDPGAEPEFVRVGFDHPAYIVYTSGTTGLPKSVVHRTGGVLVNLFKEHLLHGNVHPGDRMLYYTNTAWMMYHWSIAALGCGASVVLYDGAAIPSDNPRVLWELLDELGVTHFGTSPKYLSVMRKDGVRPCDAVELRALRFIFSAGAPLTEEQFDWVYGHVKSELVLASISGGAEILGCFVLGNPLLPVRRGEIQSPALGMSVAALDERQIPVVGRAGDLVCTEPFPSMPLTFWGEGGRQRYLKAYFGDKDEVWFHGDLAEFRASGGVVISGRTDTTLKPGGIRIGTSEIYRVVESIPGVSDSVVVGYPVEDDMEIWLFLVTDNGADVAPETIRSRLRSEASPRHVPKRIFRVPQVPYNLSGKKVEGAVLQTILGREVRNRESLTDPAALEHYCPDELASSEVGL